jgi:hypothetical protein
MLLVLSYGHDNTCPRSGKRMKIASATGPDSKVDNYVVTSSVDPEQLIIC